MKRLILSVLVVGFIGAGAQAQELGVRFGDSPAGSYAIDGIFSLGEFSRIHADVGFGNNGVGIDALWDFIYKPIGGEAFNWYVGAGATLVFGDTFQFGVPGEIGIEYHFNGAPIAIGADWRPVFIIVENTDFYTGGFGFNVRFVFGQ